MIRRRLAFLFLSAAVAAAAACADETAPTSTQPSTQPSSTIALEPTPTFLPPPKTAATTATTTMPTTLDVPAAIDPPSLLDEESVALAEGDVVDHRAEGARLLAAGDANNAVAEFKRALSVDSSADVWAALGDAYLRVGNVDRGVACLDEAVSVDVDHLPARRLLTRHFLGQNNGTVARQHAEEWVRLQPQEAAGRQALGRAFSQLGMWREAINEFSLVVEVQPDNAFAFNNLGYAYLQVGENDHALHSLERVLSLKPQQGYMLNNLGVAYERVGRTAEAHAAFARAAELSPKYAQASLNRDRVQRGLDQGQRIVSNDTLLKLRDGLFDETPPLGTGPADGIGVDLPSSLSPDGE